MFTKCNWLVNLQQRNLIIKGIVTAHHCTPSFLPSCVTSLKMYFELNWIVEK